MKRHAFESGLFVAGLVFVVVSVAYAGDAFGAWDFARHLALTIIGGGLAMAVLAHTTQRAIAAKSARSKRQRP